MVYFKAATVHKDFTSKKLKPFDDHKNFKMLGEIKPSADFSLILYKAQVHSHRWLQSIVKLSSKSQNLLDFKFQVQFHSTWQNWLGGLYFFARIVLI